MKNNFEFSFSDSEDEMEEVKTIANYVKFAPSFERVNIYKLRYIVAYFDELTKDIKFGGDLDKDSKEAQLTILKNYLMRAEQAKIEQKTTTEYVDVPIKYAHSGTPIRSYERIYSSGLQSIKKIIKNTISSEYYSDFDMANCHPSIMIKWADEYGMDVPVLRSYVSNRDEFLKHFKGHEKAFKTAILSLANGGSADFNKLKKIYKNDKKLNKLLNKLRKNINEIINKIRNDNFDEYEDYEYTGNNKLGSFVSHFNQSAEGKIIAGVIENLFGTNGWHGVNCFDGIMVEKNKYTAARINGCIPAQWREYIKIVEKPLTPVLKLPDDYKKCKAPKIIWKKLKKSLENCKTLEMWDKLKNNIVKYLNQNHAVVNDSSTYYIHEYENEYDPTGAPHFVTKGKKDMQQQLAAHNIQLDLDEEYFEAKNPKKLTDEEKKMKREIRKRNTQIKKLNSKPINIFDYWFKSPDRREYFKTVFDPEIYYKHKNAGFPPVEHPTYNLFRGLAYERDDVEDAKIADESHAFFQHIKNRTCQGNVDAYNYYLNLLALKLQRPWEKIPVALVQVGRERTGKGIIIQIFAELLGKQYLFHPISENDVFGDFNAGLADTLVCFIDELGWGGNKKNAGILKKIITEETFTINQKYMPVTKAKNHMFVIINSNEEFVVPAGQTSTRYFVTEIAEDLATMEKKEKRVTAQEILSIDRAGLAKFLYQRDISNFDPRDVVQTDALRYQKRHAMSSVHRFWLSCLENGQIGEISDYNEMGVELSEEKWTEISKNYMYEVYKDSSRSKYDTPAIFFKQLKHLFPLQKIEETRKRDDGSRVRFIYIPPLKDLKQRWRKAYDDPHWVF